MKSQGADDVTLHLRTALWNPQQNSFIKTVFVGCFTLEGHEDKSWLVFHLLLLLLQRPSSLGKLLFMVFTPGASLWLSIILRTCVGLVTLEERRSKILNRVFFLLSSCSVFWSILLWGFYCPLHRASVCLPNRLYLRHCVLREADKILSTVFPRLLISSEFLKNYYEGFYLSCSL